MKLTRVLVSILIFTAVILSLISTSYAENNPAYSISKYNSYVTINPDGSVYFDEYYTYRLHEDNVIIKKPIPMSNTSGIGQFDVYYQNTKVVDPESGESSLVPLTQSDKDASDKPNKDFYVLNDANQETYYIEIPVNGRKRKDLTYVYRYSLKDEIFVYNDTAVLFWKCLLPDSNVKEVESVEIMVSSPLVEDTFDLMGFITGTIHGEKENLEDGSLRIAADYLTDGEYIDITVLMPVDIVPEGRKLIDNYARESIINNLEVWESNAEKLRKEELRNRIIGYTLIVVAVFIILTSGLLFFIIKKQKQKYPSLASTAPSVLKSAKAAKKGLEELLLNTINKVKAFGTSKRRAVTTVSERKATGHENRKPIFRAEGLSSVANKLKLIFSGFISLIKENALNIRDKIKTLAPVDDKIQDMDKNIDIRTLVMETEDIISRISPAEQYFVYNKGNMKGESLLAEVLYLVQKRYLIIGYDEELSGTIYLNKDMDLKKLPPYDQYLISLLMKDAGSGDSLSLHEFDLFLSFARGNKLKIKLDTWADLVKRSIDKDAYSDIKRKLKHLHSCLSSMIAIGGKRLKLRRWEKYIIYGMPFNFSSIMFEKIIFSYPETVFDDGNLTILSRNNLPWLKEKLGKEYKSTFLLHKFFSRQM